MAARRALAKVLAAPARALSAAAAAPAATYALPAATKAKFLKDGWAVLPNFLSPAELQPIAAVYDRFMSGEIYKENGMTPGKDFCDMSQPFSTPFADWRIVNAMLPRRYHPALAGNIYEARAAAVAAQLFPGVAGGMRLDYDQLLNKRPKQKHAVFAWHQDMAYWPPTPDTRTVTFSLAVDATTVENGALRFLSGTGAARELRPHKPVGSGREDSHAIAVEVDEATAAIDTACVRAGDVTIHDEWVVHGSGGNTSDGPRRTYVIAFRTADTVQRERDAGFTHSHNDVRLRARAARRGAQGRAHAVRANAPHSLPPPLPVPL